jgi:hypothetical protein
MSAEQEGDCIRVAALAEDGKMGPIRTIHGPVSFVMHPEAGLHDLVLRISRADIALAKERMESLRGPTAPERFRYTEPKVESS